MATYSHTPWGHADNVEHIAEGIDFVSTPSHGGFHVATELLAQMPRAWRLEKRNDGRWFEEDCEAAMVMVWFPQHFEAATVSRARASMAHWYPSLQLPPDQRPAEDLTPEGIQLVIPGAEKIQPATEKQGELF